MQFTARLIEIKEQLRVDSLTSHSTSQRVDDIERGFNTLLDLFIKYSQETELDE